MNYILIQAILIADIGDEENSFWVQILVFLLLAVFFGVYSLTKNNRNTHKEQQQNFPEEIRTHHAKSRWRFRLPDKPVAPRKGIVQEYIAKMKDTPDHISTLSQEPKPALDSLGRATWKALKNKLTTEQNKDLRSGMDLLDLDFLLSIVENTKGNEPDDVTMRKLNFNEVLRREKLSRVKSNALTVYATNRGNLYGKDIQCEAMEELAERTLQPNRHETLQPAVLPKKGRGRTVDVK